MKKTSLALVLVASLAAPTSQTIASEIDGEATMPTVNVIGSRWVGSNSSGILGLSIAMSGVYGVYYRGPGMNAADAYDFTLDVQQLLKDKMTTPDMRCNVGFLANPLSNTMSTDDYTKKYQAVNALFQTIWAVDRGVSAKKMLSRSRTGFWGGLTWSTFDVTYADGGKESWKVETPGSSSPIPPNGDSNPQPSTTPGQAQPCPAS